MADGKDGLFGLEKRIPRGQRAAVRWAFEEMGGVDALAAWGRDNPKEFYRIWASLAPRHDLVSHSHTVRLLSPAERDAQVAELAERASIRVRMLEAGEGAEP